MGFVFVLAVLVLALRPSACAAAEVWNGSGFAFAVKTTCTAARCFLCITHRLSASLTGSAAVAVTVTLPTEEGLPDELGVAGFFFEMWLAVLVAVVLVVVCL